MKTLSCRTSRRLLAQRNAGLDDAERLHLEFHLSRCEACAEHSRALSAITKLVNGDAVKPLSPRARRRAIDASLRVLDHPVAEPALEPAPRFRITWQLGAAAVAVAGITAFVMLSNDADRVYRVSEVPQPGIGLSKADNGDADEGRVRVVSGEVSVEGGTAGTGELVGDSKRITSRRGAKLQFGDTVVAMGPNTAMGWKTSKGMIAMTRGRVRVASKTAATPLRVVTRSFAVIVAGADASVTAHGVRVHNGSVKVLSRSGNVLARRVHKRWTRLRTASNGHRRARRRATHAEPKPDPRALLQDARAAVARRDLADAREYIREARTQKLSAAQRAEALTLLADAAFVEGNRSRAVELYLDVSRRFRSLAAGQNALYAAARLQAKRGNRSAARRLYERYLQRYPDGRFRREATRSLARLTD